MNDASLDEAPTRRMPRLELADMLETSRQPTVSDSEPLTATTLTVLPGGASVDESSDDKSDAELDSVSPAFTPLRTTLGRDAETCYALFCAMERIPEWLPIVRSAQVVRKDRRGRARVVSYLARLERATVGYSVGYRYASARRRVAWSTPHDAVIRVAGFAEFAPLSPSSCLMTYHLDLELGRAGTLPGWVDPMFQGHAASAAMSEFRDFVTRQA